jgi:hypothetical protein
MHDILANWRDAEEYVTWPVGVEGSVTVHEALQKGEPVLYRCPQVLLGNELLLRSVSAQAQFSQGVQDGVPASHEHQPQRGQRLVVAFRLGARRFARLRGRDLSQGSRRGQPQGPTAIGGTDDTRTVALRPLTTPESPRRSCGVGLAMSRR